MDGRGSSYLPDAKKGRREESFESIQNTKPKSIRNHYFACEITVSFIKLFELKSWIREETGNTRLADDSILVTRLPGKGIRIQLLDGNCCRPVLDIPKALEEIKREDIRQGRHKLLHQHA